MYIFYRLMSVLAAVSFVFGQNNVKYIEDIITDNTERARSYKLPKNNKYFFGNYSSSSKIEDFGSYDFIIVGAGSTGAVLATRLTEKKNFKVLLLEAGGESTDFSDIPSMLLYLQFSDMNWGYYTTSQKTCCQGMVNKQCNYARGKVLGGSSTINALMYVRGNAEDYDKWQALGNTGWSYNNVLKYFIKSENSMVLSDPGYHGTGGELNVAYPTPEADIYQTFYDANIANGMKNLDFNGADQMGFGRVPHNIKNGKRDSTDRAFLQTARYRHNLCVVTNALATKILINNNRESYGVEFVRNGIKYKALASKEVIISAGAINTPQLLLLSGIGPEDELKKLNIKPIIDSPAVGKNLQDHACFFGLTFRTSQTVTDNDLDHQISEYLYGKGPLTNPGNNAILGFINTVNDKSKVPDVEYIMIQPNSTLDISPIQFNFNKQLSDYIKNVNPMTDFRIYLILLHPLSKGSVTLKSRDPADFPDIDISYFSDKNNFDIERMYRGIQFIMKLTKTEPFKKINTQFVPLPICKEHKFDSKQYWYCVIRQASATIYHPIGTSRMGTKKTTSVVDPQLKVHGIKNLRVADCSIFPTTTSGHTNAPAIMIGEKLADMIKEEHVSFFG